MSETAQQIVKYVLHQAEKSILQELQGMGASGWEPVYDEDENLNAPDTERSVLVFLYGDRTVADERPDDAEWGLKEGYWDTEKQYWRVGGMPNNGVTHWREAPAIPETAQ